MFLHVSQNILLPLNLSYTQDQKGCEHPKILRQFQNLPPVSRVCLTTFHEGESNQIKSNLV